MQTKFLQKHDVIISGLNSPNYREPNLKETVSGEEERGNLACSGTACVQLGEGSCPQREIETGYFWAWPPCPSLTYNHVSSTPFTISAHPSQSTTAVLSCIVPIRAYEFMGLTYSTDGWKLWGGWESNTELSQRITEENGCTGCCPLISLVYNCATVGVCSVCYRIRWGRELCVIALACYISQNYNRFNREVGKGSKPKVAHNFDETS